MSGVTRTVVPSGRSTGSNNSILPPRTTARTVLSMAHASSSGDGGFLTILLCRKVRRNAAPCLAPYVRCFGRGLLYDKDLYIFLHPMGAERYASGAAESGSEARASAVSRRLHALVRGRTGTAPRLWNCPHPSDLTLCLPLGADTRGAFLSSAIRTPSAYGLRCGVLERRKLPVLPTVVEREALRR